MGLARLMLAGVLPESSAARSIEIKVSMELLISPLFLSPPLTRFAIRAPTIARSVGSSWRRWLLQPLRLCFVSRKQKPHFEVSVLTLYHCRREHLAHGSCSRDTPASLAISSRVSMGGFTSAEFCLSVPGAVPP